MRGIPEAESPFLILGPGFLVENISVIMIICPYAEFRGGVRGQDACFSTIVSSLVLKKPPITMSHVKSRNLKVTGVIFNRRIPAERSATLTHFNTKRNTPLFFSALLLHPTNIMSIPLYLGHGAGRLPVPRQHRGISLLHVVKMKIFSESQMALAN